jgi:hypothetical protein
VKRAVRAVVGALYRLALAIFARDLGVGTSLRPLGPLAVRIDAPREVVFDVIAGPYLGRTPRALESKLKVVERHDDTVVAEHYTQTGQIVATTLETVRFVRPDSVEFRLVRGPVPYVVERFELRDADGGTELGYTGELGTDLWALGRWWGGAVAKRWEATVQHSFDSIKQEAERRAG